MGGACCVAREKEIANGSASNIVRPTVHLSPPMASGWDNHGRVADEETSASLFADRISRNREANVNYGVTSPSEDGSPLTHQWQKASRSPHFVHARIPPSGFSFGHPTMSSDGYQGEEKSVVISSHGGESTRGSHTDSSDTYSVTAFSELLMSSRGERCQYDDIAVEFNMEKMESNAHPSSSTSGYLQTCGICSKLLMEKSLWSTRKIIPNNELPVVSVLTCGHVYHAECLEALTPEVQKYDPSCPVCTLGEKHTHKLMQKAFKMEMDLKRKKKKSRSRVVDCDLSDAIVVDHLKPRDHEGKSPKLGFTSGLRSAILKPNLKRPFSFGYRVSGSPTDNGATPKRGGFWTRSVKD